MSNRLPFAIACILTVELAVCDPARTAATQVSIASPDFTQFIAPTPVDREVHVIGIYEAGASWDGVIPDHILNDPDPNAFVDWWVANVQHNHPTFDAHVRVAYDDAVPMQPITLVLSSYEPVAWNFEIDEGAIVDQIVLNGYHQQSVVGAGDIPVTNFSPYTQPSLSEYPSQWPINTGGSSMQGLLVAIEEQLGTRISSFTGSYRSSGFMVQGSPVGAPTENPTVGAGSLEDGPNADLIYNATTGEVSIDLLDVARNNYPRGDGSIWWQHFDAQRLFVALANNDGSFASDALDVRGERMRVPREVSANEFRIGLDSWMLRNWDGQLIEFGAVFPTGIADAAELRDYLAAAHFATDHERGELDLIVVSGDIPIGAVGEIACDFNTDEFCDTLDIDLLSAEVVSHLGQPPSDDKFDMTGDGVVDLADRDEWLLVAAIENGFAESYSLGDTNLDGFVSATDLMMVGLNWQSSGGRRVRFSGGDFDMNDVVDSRDLNLLALNWQRQIAPADVTAVPEPSAILMWLAAATGIWHLARRYRRTSIGVLAVGAVMLYLATHGTMPTEQANASINDTDVKVA